MRLADLIGQTRATTVLRNAIRRERVAHAYLFRGPAGVGKSTAARAFAQALNCEDPARAETGDACGECRSCRLIAAESHPDVWTVSFILDKKGKLRTEISIHQIRRLPEGKDEAPRPIVQDAILRPVLGRHKVYIINPADKMSPPAESALLKLIEEPPPYVVLVLVTSQAAKLFETTRSRCQPITFQLAGTGAVEAHLRALGLEAEVAASLAALSGGRVGWAIEAARQPAVLEVRQGLVDLCERLEMMGPAESLRAADEIKGWALGLAAGREAAVRADGARSTGSSRAGNGTADAAEDEDEGDSAGAGERAPGRDRVLRVELPWCLDVIALWYRDRMTATAESGEHAARVPHYEQAIEAAFAAKRQIQRNANIDLALEAMAIQITAAGAAVKVERGT